MCGFGKDSNPFNKNKFLYFENYKEILCQINDKTETIRLNGRGESTIHPDFIGVLNYTKRNFPQLNINLFSNFSFNNKNIIDALIVNCVQLFISIDSPYMKELSTIRKGANFQYLENNIKQVEELQNRPFVVFTIQERNIHRIYEIAQFAFENHCQILYNTIRRNKGIEIFVDAVRRNYQSILEQFEQGEKLYANSGLQYLYPDQLAGIKLRIKKFTQTHGTMKQCPALDKELCILYDGTIIPCNMFNPYVYGNIFCQSLNEIWESKKRKMFLRSHKYCCYCRNCANLEFEV
ncbi:MAG: SPASM domain-containing protein [Tannerellaceae bacterium]|jgi:MoaA/NifB/PqqE/SkfB family radical SAM enzyme|nr:SPASM domain-containing protein [Tannerellaceae bacterium]